MEGIHREQGDEATAHFFESAAATADAMPPAAAGTLFPPARPCSSLLLSGAVSTAAASPTSNESTGSSRQHPSSSKTAADALKEATSPGAAPASTLTAARAAATPSVVEAARTTITRSTRATTDAFEPNVHLDAATTAATSRRISAAKHIDNHTHIIHSAAEETDYSNNAAASSPPSQALFGLSGAPGALRTDGDSSHLRSSLAAPLIATTAAGSKTAFKREIAIRGEAATREETATEGETAAPGETASRPETATRRETAAPGEKAPTGKAAARREVAAEGRIEGKTADGDPALAAPQMSERSAVPLRHRKLGRSAIAEFPAPTSITSCPTTAAAAIDADNGAAAHGDSHPFGAQRLRDMLLKKKVFLASSLRRSRIPVSAQQNNTDVFLTEFAAHIPEENKRIRMPQEQLSQPHQLQQPFRQQPFHNGIQEQMSQQQENRRRSSGHGEELLSSQQARGWIDEREMQHTLPSQQKDISQGVYACSEDTPSNNKERFWAYPEKGMGTSRRQSSPSDAVVSMRFPVETDGEQPRHRRRTTQQHVAAFMPSSMGSSAVSYASAEPHMFSKHQHQDQHTHRPQQHYHGHPQQQQQHPPHYDEHVSQQQQTQQQRQRQQHSTEHSQQHQHEHPHHYQQHYFHEHNQQQQHTCGGSGSTAAVNTVHQQQGKQNFRLRALWGVILVLSFVIILAAGHVYTTALVLALVALMYREIIAVKRRRDEGRLPPDFTLLKWYWFTITILGMGIPAVSRLPWIFPTFPWTTTTSNSRTRHTNISYTTSRPPSGISYSNLPPHSSVPYSNRPHSNLPHSNIVPSNLPHSSIPHSSTPQNIPLYKNAPYRNTKKVIYDGNMLPSGSSGAELRNAAFQQQQQQMVTHKDRIRPSCSDTRSISERRQDSSGCLCDSSSIATGGADISAAAMLPADMRALTSSMSSAIQASLRSSSGASAGEGGTANTKGNSYFSVFPSTPLFAAVSDDSSHQCDCLQETSSACEHSSYKREARSVKDSAASFSSSDHSPPGGNSVAGTASGRRASVSTQRAVEHTSSPLPPSPSPAVASPSPFPASPSPQSASPSTLVESPVPPAASASRFFPASSPPSVASSPFLQGPPSPVVASPSPLVGTASPLVASSAWGLVPGGEAVVSPGSAGGSNSPVGMQLWGHASPDRVLAVYSLLVYAAAFVGLVWFILSLRKGMLRSQFSQLGVMLIASVFIVTQAFAQIANIYSGLIWFLLPSVLVIVNDVSAYICGKLFGRTRLIRLSPKKTVEGFVGASLVTLLCASVASKQLQQYSALTCQPTAIDLRPFAVWKELHCPEWEVFKPRCFDADIAALLPSFLAPRVALKRGPHTSVDTLQQQLSALEHAEMDQEAPAARANAEKEEEREIAKRQGRSYGRRDVSEVEAGRDREEHVLKNLTVEDEREEGSGGDSNIEGGRIGDGVTGRRRCTKKTWRGENMDRNQCAVDRVINVDDDSDTSFFENTSEDGSESLGGDRKKYMGNGIKVATSTTGCEGGNNSVAGLRQEAGDRQSLPNKEGTVQQQADHKNNMSGTEESTQDKLEYILQQQQTVTDTFDIPKIHPEAPFITSSSISSSPVHHGEMQGIEADLSAPSLKMTFHRDGKKRDNISSPGAGDVAKKRRAASSSEEVTQCGFYISPFQLHAIVLGVFAAFFAPFGGFLASGFKRAARVKDFGEVIPGHGGITDRFDCQVLMGTFTHLYYKSFVYVAPDLVTPVSPLATQVAGGFPAGQLILTHARQHPGTGAPGISSPASPAAKHQQHMTATLGLLQQQHPTRRPSKYRKCKGKETKKTRHTRDKKRLGGAREEKGARIAFQAHREATGERRGEGEELRRRSGGGVAEERCADEKTMLQQQIVEEHVYRPYVSKGSAGALGSHTSYEYRGEVVTQSGIDEPQQQHRVESGLEREATELWEESREGSKNKQDMGEKDVEDSLTGEEEEEDEEEGSIERDIYLGDILEVVASIDDVRELELVNEVVLEKMAFLQEQQQQLPLYQKEQNEEQLQLQ